ncbi:branched-chain amino acid ABC transporter permease [Thiohalorhabdus sp. Cl-TMA]|uniref:Branched-chain amino acid ABC transporter permease n=1 Tax=Thiohalorhabdus methylotrophus TaxID=3242694 RepID=A0ABV4TXE9_9GAMM
MAEYSSRIGWGLLLAVAVVVPFFLSYSQMDIAIALVVNVLLVSSYRWLTLTGEFSLAHAVLMGVGAYGSGLLAKDLGWPFWFSLPAAGLITAFVAFLLSFPLFRMKLFYFLIGSFAAGEAIRLSWNYFDNPFGGPGGLTMIPTPQLWVPTMGVIDIGLLYPIRYYFLALAIVTLCLWILHRLERSRIGLTLHALHWRDELAESVGVHAWYYRMLAFVTSAFFAGVAGSLHAHYIGTVTPPIFGLHLMVLILVWLIVGGSRTFAGPIVGVIALTMFNEFFRFAEEVRPAFYGVMLILATLFLPDGLESIPGKIRGWWQGRKGTSGGGQPVRDQRDAPRSETTTTTSST